MASAEGTGGLGDWRSKLIGVDLEGIVARLKALEEPMNRVSVLIDRAIELQRQLDQRREQA